MYAMQHNLSVSGLTENLYRRVPQSEERDPAKNFGPIAQKYKGIIKNKDLNIEEVKLAYLREKHGE